MLSNFPINFYLDFVSFFLSLSLWKYRNAETINSLYNNNSNPEQVDCMNENGTNQILMC